MLKKDHYVITGASGFIGNAFYNYLDSKISGKTILLIDKSSKVKLIAKVKEIK